MFSCSHFLSNRNQSVMSKRDQGSTFKDGSALAKPRPVNFGVKEPTERKKNLCARFECFEQPEESIVRSESGFMERQENWCETTTKTHQHTLKSGDKMTLHFRAPGNWCGLLNLQVQGAPKGQGWNSTISPIIATKVESRRRSTNTPREGPVYWSGDYSCRRRCKPLFIFGQNTMKIWKYTGTQSSKSSRTCSTSRRDWYRNTKPKSECTTDWLDSVLIDEIYACARSSNQVDESKSTRLLRFRLVLGEDARIFRSKPKMEGATRRMSDSPVLTENYLELMENWSSSSGIFTQDLLHSLEILQKIQEDLQGRNSEPLKFEGRIISMSMFKARLRQEPVFVFP